MWETFAAELATTAFSDGDGAGSFSIPDELYSQTGNVDISVAGINTGNNDVGSRVMVGVFVALSVIAIVAMVKT